LKTLALGADSWKIIRKCKNNLVYAKGPKYYIFNKDMPHLLFTYNRREKNGPYPYTIHHA
jgi:hypothetical protein